MPALIESITIQLCICTDLYTTYIFTQVKKFLSGYLKKQIYKQKNIQQTGFEYGIVMFVIIHGEPENVNSELIEC